MEPSSCTAAPSRLSSVQWTCRTAGNRDLQPFQPKEPFFLSGQPRKVAESRKVKFLRVVEEGPKSRRLETPGLSAGELLSKAAELHLTASALPIRSVSTVRTSVSRHVLPSSQPRRKVCTIGRRRRRRSLVASTLPELLEQAARVIMLSCRSVLTLDLEEDGTVVDSEESITLHSSVPPAGGSSSTALVPEQLFISWVFQILPSFREPRKKGVFELTSDLYEAQPADLLCCLALRTTPYETYSLSDEFSTRVRRVLRSVLRCVTWLTRVTGQLLLCTSSSLLQFTAAAWRPWPDRAWSPGTFRAFSLASEELIGLDVGPG
ncbi:LOW QUALITY PROTEIN: lipid transferase CIDEB [Anableps anableps]